MQVRIGKWLAGLIVFLTLAHSAFAQELRVAAAADLQFALNDLAAQFEKQFGTHLAVTFGASGTFFAQIQNAAPFDVFLSADRDYPVKLESAGLTEPGSLRVYARGHLVLWAPPGATYLFEAKGLNALQDPKIEKIAIANPEHAPYGRAAVAALKTAGLYEELQHKLVYGENISQAAQFVQSGNAQVGLIALSLARSPAMKDGQIWEIAQNWYPPIEQAAVILKSAKNKEAARAFLEFLGSDTARKTLQEYGFSVDLARVKASP
jgi:molybdate transport system substrate-binding protein